MKKNFLYVALGLVGIMGSLSIGVVNADYTITFKLNGGYWTEDGTTGDKTKQYNGSGSVTDWKTPSKYPTGNTKWMFDGWYLGASESSARRVGSVTSDMTVYAHWLPFLDETITVGDETIVMMDRNLGATGTGYCRSNNKGPCGYHFQWGNNYGFTACISSPGGESTGGAVEFDDWKGHTGDNASTYYSNIWAYTASSWFLGGTDENSKLWGTADDEQSMQGPCPGGYHVPTKDEREKFVNAGITPNTMGLTYAGSRNLSLGCGGYCYVLQCSSFDKDGSYWSSDKGRYLLAKAATTWTQPSISIPTSSSATSYAYSVRCLRNSSIKTLTFDVSEYQGASPTVSFIDVEVGDTVDLSQYEGTKPYRDFIGRNTYKGATDPIAENYNAYPITEDTTLYAVFRPSSSTPIYTITFDVTTNGGTDSTTGSIEVVSGDTVDLSSYTGYKEDYKFIGWNTSSTATWKLTSNYNAYLVTGNTTLYAIFKKLPKLWTIESGDFQDKNIGGVIIMDRDLGWDGHTLYYQWGENEGVLAGEYLDSSSDGTWTEQDQGPCPDGYHVPSRSEWSSIKSIGSCNGACNSTVKDNFGFGWNNYHGSNSTTAGDNSNYSFYWSSYWSSANSSSSPYFAMFYRYSSTVEMQIGTNPSYRNYGFSIRCFRDPIKNIVTFDYTANGGTDATTGSIKVISGNTLNLTLYTGTKEGWDFVGWNTNSGAHEAISTNYNAYPITENITLYAIFKKEGTTLTGTIIQNGATVTPIETGCNIPTIYNNESVVTECTLTFPTATRTNGTVYGYSTDNIETDSPTIINGGTYNISANTTFYVISKGTLTGTFYKNGNTSQTPNGEDVSTAESVTTTCDLWNTNTGCNITTPTFVPASGKTPRGYTTDADISDQDSPTYISTNTSITLSTTSANEYYAQSKSDDIVLHINYLSGVGVQSIGNDSGSCTLTGTWNSTEQATSCTVTAPSITLKDGYGTGIWSTGSIIVNPGSDITLTADDTYTASATPNTYTVKFEAGEGTGTMSNQEFTYDVTGSLTANAFTRTGYTFSGWTNGTTGYADGQEVSNLTTTNNDIITFTAQWTPITYTIDFSGNATNVSGTQAPINAEYDSGDITPESSFTLTGYTFTEWNTESDGSGTGYVTGDTLKNLTATGGDVVTLYAQWKANKYTVTFDVNGGNALTSNTGAVTYDAAYGTLPTPSRGGYSFNGWFTAATNGTKITATTVVSATGDHILYAQWTQNPVSGGSSSGGGSSGGGGSSKAKTSSDSVKSTETQTGSKVDSSTKATDSEDNTQDSSAKASEGQNQGKTYSDEFQQAYEFAYKHGITTMPSIEQANMEGPLTRIAMAKMLSYYAINVLGQKPDETRINKFNDITEKLDAQYDNGVTLAYQLGIMGINMQNNNFRPNDLVTRAEFATALSRMLYKIADGKDRYYSTHMAKLMEEKIITNNNPNLQELRGYVMIMLMRSAK